MEDKANILGSMKNVLLKGGILLGLVSFLANPPTEVEASFTNITNVTNQDSHSIIRVSHDGVLELPDGSRVSTSNIQYNVTMNGVYTFHTYGDNDAISRDSVLIDTIKKTSNNLEVTNKKQVTLDLISRDNLSGIQQYSLKNESSGAWSSWTNVNSADNVVEQSINWTLDTTKEGIRTVFARFRDKAGNITESQLNSAGSKKHPFPYAEVIYTTKGPEFDVGIVDLNKQGSTYWVSPNRTYKVRRSSNPYVEVVFNNIRSEWSTPQNVYTSVNGQPYQKRPVSSITSDGRLIIDIPVAERKNGPGEIRIYIDDLVVNNSEIHTIPYYYDDTVPNVDHTIRQGDGKNLKQTVFYNPITNKDDNVNMTLTQNVLLDVTPRDAHSSMNRQTARPGFARILVREQTRYEHEGSWKNNKTRVFARSNDVADGHPFTSIALTDGSKHTLDLPLSHGFETRYIIETTDNAGNTRTVTTAPFRQSNLRLVSFKILEIINPSREDDEVIITDQMNPEDLPIMSAGGNVTLEAAFDLQNAFEYKNLEGVIEIEISGNGYSKKLDNIVLTEYSKLTDKSFPRFEEVFTIPEDAPVGAEVIMKGWLTVDFDDNVSHTIYFPSKNGNISWRIGVIGNHIQDHLKFNITR